MLLSSVSFNLKYFPLISIVTSAHRQNRLCWPQQGFTHLEDDFSDLNGLLGSLNSCKARECVVCLLS